MSQSNLRKPEINQAAPPDGVFQFEVYNISALDEHCRSSNKIEVGGVQWRVDVCKKEEDDGDWLVALLSVISENHSKIWSIEVNKEIILVNPDNIENNVIKSETSTHNYEATTWGTYLMKWNDLIDEDNGFIIDDKITVELRFWISKTEGIRCNRRFNFSFGDSCSDVVLIVEGKQIHVSKQYLGIHSGFFQTLFFGKLADKEQKEFRLEDVIYEEFIQLLKLIYPPGKEIKDERAEFLLKLSYRFQIESVISRAEQSLINYEVDNISTIMDKLILADQYNLINLKKHCLNVIDRYSWFKDVKADSNYDNLSDMMKTALFERMVESAKKKRRPQSPRRWWAS